MRAVDVSNPSSIDAAWIKQEMDSGVELFITDLWTGNRKIYGAESFLKLVRSLGGKTGAYFAVHNYSPTNALYHFRMAKSVAVSEWQNLSVCLVDFETEPVTTSTIKDAYNLVIADGINSGLYTGGWFWHLVEGSPSILSDLPLWAAQYDGKPELMSVNLFGPWGNHDNIIGKQYIGDLLVRGTFVDYSNFDDNFINRKIGDTMDQKHVDDLNTAMNLVYEVYKELAAEGKNIQAKTVFDAMVSFKKGTGLQ